MAGNHLITHNTDQQLKVVMHVALLSTQYGQDSDIDIKLFVFASTMTTEKAPNEGPNGPRTEVIEKYSVFTTAEKWCVVAIVSYAAWFSTLSSFIYYPAIPALSKTLAVPVNKINLTVTTYMSVATIAPTLVGDAAEILGRRPIYVITLSIYFVANLAIALSKSYSALLGLRALQAFAISGMCSDLIFISQLTSSGTFSIAYGVVTDVASPAERGSFGALVSFA